MITDSLTYDIDKWLDAEDKIDRAVERASRDLQFYCTDCDLPVADPDTWEYEIDGDYIYLNAYGTCPHCHEETELRTKRKEL